MMGLPQPNNPMLLSVETPRPPRPTLPVNGQRRPDLVAPEHLLPGSKSAEPLCRHSCEGMRVGVASCPLRGGRLTSDAAAGDNQAGAPCTAPSPCRARRREEALAGPSAAGACGRVPPCAPAASLGVPCCPGDTDGPREPLVRPRPACDRGANLLLPPPVRSRSLRARGARRP
jgi:hypothetical protein